MIDSRFMAYSTKVEENCKIIKKCVDLSAYNVGASRAYYCTFIKVKSFLDMKGFDYQGFLDTCGLKNEKPYSHGTIKRALIKCLVENKIKANYYQLNVMDNLYNKRKIADYKEMEISQPQFEESVREMEIVSSVIGV